jgi:hypothetical protein
MAPMEVMGSVACNGNPVKNTGVPSGGLSIEIAVTAKSISGCLETISSVVLQTATSKAGFAWQSAELKANHSTLWFGSRFHPPGGKVMAGRQTSLSGDASMAAITWLAVMNVPFLSIMKAVPTIWNLDFCVPVAASRTRQTIGATAVLANATESVETVADCEGAAIGVRKNKQAAEQYRIIRQCKDVRLAIWEMGGTLSPINTVTI